MSVQRTAFQAYNQAMHTVAKTRQVVMLYDGAIRYMQQAKQAIEARQIEERYKLLIRVSEILMGLQSALDFDQGGDVARILYDFYSSLDARLTRIHRNNSLELCDEVIEELKQMRGVWQEIDSGRASAEAATAPTSEPLSHEATTPSSTQETASSVPFLPSDFSA